MEGAQGLSAEVVSLLNEQAFAQGESFTEQEVCESFTRILLRHWDLCSVSTFLRGEGGDLDACTSFTHGHLDGEAARALGGALAAEVARTGEELGVGVGEGEEGGASRELGELMGRAGVEACVAVPIRASGATAGVLVVASKDAGRLREAVGGVRCVGQAVVIALGNARRSAASAARFSRRASSFRRVSTSS